MSIMNDDGLPLDLNVVFVLFSMPNLIFIILILFIGYLIRLSRKHPRLKYFLSRLANFFSKGALDRIIRNILHRFDTTRHIPGKSLVSSQLNSIDNKRRSFQSPRKSLTLPSYFNFERKYNANYLLLVPFQLDLLLTVLAYKILTRDVYQETCQSYLTTYHDRSKQIVCWLKNINRNISNLSTNVSLYQYCLSQAITYINYEHNDVICVHYAFKLINIIDTVTNIFAWHQAVVFIVTKSIVFCYWYQHKLRKTSFCINLLKCQRRIIIIIIIICILIIYILLFIFVIPIWFLLFERRRVDLTRHLLYACLKFLIAAVLHINVYVLYQWHSFHSQKKTLIKKNEKEEQIQSIRRLKSVTNSDCESFYSGLTVDNRSSINSPSNILY